MRLAHKRKVQMKLQKRSKVNVSNTLSSQESTQAKETQVVAAAAVEVKVEKAAEATVSTVALTPKQQQVLDIVLANVEGINSKSIGLAAGQDESKAASWATGALKKLLTESLVQKEQLSGNKVIYKPV
ncbi:MarR family transcriptional regulator [Vibrio rarus]|uniref:MarR family transcriptional regulator n=1 Tax=Vibrio rarus TaxID=413403 RepID=UPI0021C3768E|nr:MarR family transcriptional regulator [Vibrio rarus]